MSVEFLTEEPIVVVVVLFHLIISLSLFPFHVVSHPSHILIGTGAEKTDRQTTVLPFTTEYKAGNRKKNSMKNGFIP